MIESSDVLDVKDLSVRFGGQEVLRGLSFGVPRGTSLSVIGPNGAGKTVLFRALIGAVPYTGTITWAPGSRLGYVPQRIDIERGLPITGRDLLVARANVASVPRQGIERAITRVGLTTEVLSALVGTMSSGQFQRLLMAFALLGDPNVLLLDEPTAGVDEPGQERLNETLHRLQVEDGVTVLLISHELSVVSRYATTVLCLTREHTCFGVPRQALTPDVLAKVYGEPVDLFIHDGDGR
jgi:zinc transport system ATP-binding protein